MAKKRRKQRHRPAASAERDGTAGAERDRTATSGTAERTRSARSERKDQVRRARETTLRRIRRRRALKRATWMGGLGAVTFAAFFLLILFSNWSGLLPFFGRVEAFRAPTSDVNVTLGLALVAFFYFHFQGFRALGVRGYLGKFFVFSGFKEGPAAGLIGLFVGLIEFLLEFIKPITLSMRLFGNIYGGEVALGVITALTITIIPVALFGLEVMLNAIQALIFSVLTLMFIVLAIESHHDEEGHVAEEAIDAIDGEGPKLQPAH